LEVGTREETEEERIERERKDCQFQCDCYNKEQGDLGLYDCKRCNNKGDIFEPRWTGRFWQQHSVPCKCMKVRRALRALHNSGLATIVHDYTFDKYIATEPWQKDILNKAALYLKDEHPYWWFFGGQSGCGKSHLCTAIAITLLKRENEVKYMLWRDEASKLKSMVNDPDYADEIEKYKKVDVLYIDDLFKVGKGADGKARPTTADVNLAFEILNARIVRKKRTIISSEFTLADLIDLDEASAGRVKQQCGEYGKYCINVQPDRKKNYRLK
jgi:DNA replication protein DnaC